MQTVLSVHSATLLPELWSSEEHISDYRELGISNRKANLAVLGVCFYTSLYLPLGTFCSLKQDVCASERRRQVFALP